MKRIIVMLVLIPERLSIWYNWTGSWAVCVVLSARKVVFRAELEPTKAEDLLWSANCFVLTVMK